VAALDDTPISTWRDLVLDAIRRDQLMEAAAHDATGGADDSAFTQSPELQQENRRESGRETEYSRV
jgi:hypothetical protein